MNKNDPLFEINKILNTDKSIKSQLWYLCKTIGKTTLVIILCSIVLFCFWNFILTDFVQVNEITFIQSICIWLFMRFLVLLLGIDTRYITK